VQGTVCPASVGMGFESGSDYLRRLKRAVEKPGTHAPVSPAVAEPAADSKERRQSPRYKCEGSAEFRVDGSDVRTWGTLTDLSLHGCYIEMTATYPVGAVVNLGLELHGLHVDMKGEVRVSYPFLGIGVAFRDVSEDSQQRMRDMVRALMPSSQLAASPKPPARAMPASAPALPVIVNPTAALQALVDYFDVRHTLTHEEFIELIRKSQTSAR
jgi:hypothetical protein